MKAVAGIVVVALASVLASSTAARAYKIDDDGNGHPLHWQTKAASYFLVSGNNPAGAAGEAAVHAAFQTWNEASSSLQYSFAGYLSQGAQAYDGKNVVSWVSRSWPYDSTLAAITYRYYDTSDGRLLDADIVFNGEKFSWSVGGSGYDIQNSATHEVGHFSGLGHSTDLQATMYGGTTASEIKKRDLGADDLAALDALYGGVSSAATDRADKIGVFRPATGVWYVDRSGNGTWNGCTIDGCLGSFGVSGDQPVPGHWSGAARSEIGVFRASVGAWALDPNGNGRWDGCGVDGCVSPYGILGDRAVAGDWGNLGRDAVGVFRPRDGRWYLDANGNGRWDGCTIDDCLGPFGMGGDQPVAGDWTGSGTVHIGVFRPSDGRWYLDRNGDGQWNGCAIDLCLGPFGMNGDQPVVGDWTGTGVARIGVFRPSDGRWYLDRSGDGQWNGCATDACLGPFGMKGDVAVVGKW